MAQTDLPSQRLSLSFANAFPAAADEIKQLLDDLWVAHVNTNEYEGHWSVLPLRSLSQHANAHPILQSFALEERGTWQDLPILTELPTIKNILTHIQCEKKSVRLMQLQPLAIIKRHRDEKLNIESGEARLHLPLQFTDNVEFMSNDKKLEMHPGELWYINADQPHSVKNSGTKARINLVIDCVANPWLYSKFVKTDKDIYV